MTIPAYLLQTLISGNKIGTLANNIGINIIMSTIKATTSSISGLIGYIMTDTSKDMDHIIKLLKIIDLQFTVVTMQSFINEQDVADAPKSISTSLYGVSEILTTINNDLQSIKNEYDSHKSKYFSAYRTFAWSGSIETLKNHNDILKHRHNILFELLKINKSCGNSGLNKNHDEIDNKQV